MKKKLTITSIAAGNLRQRRRQYAVMITGIIMAMVFSTSIILFLFSSNESNTEEYYNKNGSQQLIAACTENKDAFYAGKKASGVIDNYGTAHIIGYAYSQERQQHMGTAVAWLDKAAQEISRISLDEGRMPENENEIAIERIALIKLGAESKIGDKITLNFKAQNGDEYLETVTSTFTLVGILNDKRSNILQFYADESDSYPIVPAAFVAEGTKTLPGGKELYSAYIECGNDVYTDTDKLFGADANGGEYIELSEMILSDKASFSLLPYNDNGMFTVLTAVVLMLASCVAIINSFNTNLKERKQQIGMLRAVGATKKQIRDIFSREALIISLICTPVSVAASYGVVRLLLEIINTETTMTKSIAVLPVAAVTGIAVVMISAAIPLVSASRITPMQAIRNIEESRKFKVKKIKSKKEFSVPVMLAKRSMWLYKGSRAAVSVMLIATIVSSCFCFSYISYAGKDVYAPGFDYNIWGLGQGGVSHNFYNIEQDKTGLSDTDKAEIESLAYVDRAYATKEIPVLLETDEITDYLKSFTELHYSVYGAPQADGPGEELTKEQFKKRFLASFSDEYLQLKRDFGIDKEALPFTLEAIDLFMLKQLEDFVVDGSINPDKLRSGEEVVLVAPQSAEFKVSFYGNGYKSILDTAGAFKNESGYETIVSGENHFKAGDKVKLSSICGTDIDQSPSEMKKIDKEVTIGAVVSPDNMKTELYFPIDFKFGFLTSHSAIGSFTPNTSYQQLYVDCGGEIDDDINEYLTEELQLFADKYGGTLNSVYAREKSGQQYIKTMFVSVLALMIIAFSVCAGIINNTMSASIRESKKQIGTLRAFGASKSDMTASYMRRLLSMFFTGVGAGFGLFVAGFLIALAVNLYKKKTVIGYDVPLEMVFSPWITLAFCAILFCICLFNLWLNIKKETKNSIIDNIREL